MSLKLGIGAVLLALFAGSAVWRLNLETSAPTAQDSVAGTTVSTESGGATGLVAGRSGQVSGSGEQSTTKPSEPAKDDGEPSPLEDWLPMVTEGSFFAFIGFALGYFSRKMLKLAMIFIAILFIIMQTMSYLGVVTINWDRAIELVNSVILNLKENQTVTEVIKDRIPAAGGLLAGVLLGWRRG